MCVPDSCLLDSKPVASLWAGTMSCILFPYCPYSGSEPICPGKPTGNPRAPRGKEPWALFPYRSSSPTKQHIESDFYLKLCKTKSCQILFYFFFTNWYPYGAELRSVWNSYEHHILCSSHVQFLKISKYIQKNADFWLTNILTY